jgi:hypothetical protein
MTAPPLEEWERVEAVRSLARILEVLDEGLDFVEDVAPVLRRLTRVQRGFVEEALLDLEEKGV